MLAPPPLYKRPTHRNRHVIAGQFLAFFVISFFWMPDCFSVEEKIRPLAIEDKKIFANLNRQFRNTAFKSSVEKTVHLELLEKERKSKGEFLLHQGRLKMELKGDENSLLLINKKKLYAVSFPGKDEIGSKINVIEARVSSGQVRKQGLMVLLADGGFDSMFQVTGVQDLEKHRKLYFLSPKPETKGLNRAQVAVQGITHPKLESLTYWDELGNKTEYSFSAYSNPGKIKNTVFEYTIPPEADVMREE